MSSIREAVRRLLGRAREETGAQTPRPLLSYTLYWTKQAREWSRERRQRVRQQVATLTSRPGFEATTYQRRYRVVGLDTSAHAGASLLALLRVLDGFERHGAQSEEDDQ